VEPVPVPAPIAPVVPAPTPGTSVDQLLDRLTDLRRQKAELEKQELLLVKQLHDKLKAQTERLEKLGLAPEPLKPPLPREEVKAEEFRLPLIDKPQLPR
jgi:hypothetical protein